MKGNYFKVNVANRIIKMRVDIEPKLPEAKSSMFYRILYRVKPQIREKLKFFLILGTSIYTPTASTEPLKVEAEYENTKYKITCT